MTIICALHDGRETWIGSDSRITNGDMIVPAVGRKWIIKGGTAVGWSGDHRVRLLLERMEFGSPEQMADGILAALKDAGFRPAVNKPDGAPAYCSSFIYATPSGVWGIDQSGSVSHVFAGHLWARGSGMEYALGADFASRDFAEPEHRIRVAVSAAIAYDTGCGGEIFYHRLTP